MTQFHRDDTDPPVFGYFVQDTTNTATEKAEMTLMVKSRCQRTKM